VKALKVSENKEPRVMFRCGGCGKKQEFVNSGRFRVNANGKSVDVWLIYSCKKCKHSKNLTIYERTNPGRIPMELFECFMNNGWTKVRPFLIGRRKWKNSFFIT